MHNTSALAMCTHAWAVAYHWEALQSMAFVLLPVLGALVAIAHAHGLPCKPGETNHVQANDHDARVAVLMHGVLAGYVHLLHTRTPTLQQKCRVLFHNSWC